MKSWFKEKIKISHPLSVLAIVSIVFLVFQFIVISPMKVGNGIGPKFDWPDEVANYFWARELVVNNRLAIPEPLNLIADNQIHPRSFNTNIYGALVPGSFLGLIILFAFLAKFFSIGAIIYFTPILTVVGAWAFYYIIRKAFNNENIALVSSSLLLFSAPWLYYSFESLLPNAPTISIFLLAICLLLYAKKSHHWTWALSGFFLGTALAIRPAEFIWMGLAFLVILIIRRKDLSVIDFVSILVGGFLAILPMMIHQQIIYGSFLISGYDKLPELAQQSSVFGKLVKQALIPFGINPRLALHNFWHYFVLISPITSALSFLGVLLYLKNWHKQKKSSKVYFFLTIFIFAWLFNYYGSWLFEDLRTLSMNKLGASYVRYWLILFALSLPFAAITIEAMIKYWKPRLLRLLVIIIFMVLGFYQVLFSDPNNILSVRLKVADNRVNAGLLLKDIPENAVIVTNRSDKIFFPERRVIESYGLRGSLEDSLPVLKTIVPVYIHEDGILKPY